MRASRNVSPEPLRLGILANGSAGELALLVRPLRGWKHQGPAVAGGSLLVTPARVSAKRDCFTEVGPPAAVVGPFTGVPAVLAGRRSRTGVAPSTRHRWSWSGEGASTGYYFDTLLICIKIIIRAVIASAGFGETQLPTVRRNN